MDNLRRYKITQMPVLLFYFSIYTLSRPITMVTVAEDNVKQKLRRIFFLHLL